MGCGKSKQAGVTPDIPAVDVSQMDRFMKVEARIAPLYRVRIDVFEGRVKRFVCGKSSLTLAQLRYAFQNDSKFSDLQVDDSLFVKVLQSEYF